MTMNDEQNTAPNWLQEGDLLYRLTIDTHRQNHDEIYVTLAEGSRDIRARAARAAELREALNRIEPNKPTGSATSQALTTLRRLIAADEYSMSFQTIRQYRSALLREIDRTSPTPPAAIAMTHEQNAAIEFALGACAGHPAGEQHVAALESLLNDSNDAQIAIQLTNAARDVLIERRRQIEQEGWTPEHDDKCGDLEISCAAGCYAMYTLAYPAGDPPPPWPWATDWWKPTTQRRNLVKAAALILAELERLDRLRARAGERK
ncbi:hypothetical protein [Burkholderia pseudomallei]|uniref:hypothetical protein n=1 Tax=Burkholderia pseudomallei TaxID=28450 RepID=UPI00057238EF|nr:hypothetical protein [Burkholderia pseudomallei]